MISKITGGETEFLFKSKVLCKYEVKYYQCKETGFIQTEDPYWLEEAYSSAITSLDLGLLDRNIHYSAKVEKIILNFFNPEASFLDYAGGYGTFTRLMRDRGLNFFHTDKYCENLFAKYFELDDSNHTSKFELITAFELFEHLNSPLIEIEQMFQFSDTILFSTELVPNVSIHKSEDWWYIAPETGQHIAFYTSKSLEYLAKHFKSHFYSDGNTFHMLTKKNFGINPIISPQKEPFLIRKLRKILKELDPLKRRNSLLQKDWEHVKMLIYKNLPKG